MFDKNAQILYVGKAKNLKKRVASYFRAASDDLKTHVLVNQIANIEVVVTATENEALLLENTLIKKLKPKYNILFKDDKSYPYLHLSAHLFPRLSLYRGSQKAAGNYYGPYPSAGSARETLQILQKIFLLRQCGEVFFRNRSRPCVQYQIKRCSAPCVGYIEKNDYQRNVDRVEKFLRGQNKSIIQEIKGEMKSSALSLDYEKAALLRDQLTNLQKIYQQQYVFVKQGDIDAIAIVEHNSYFCIHILFVRNGKVISNKSYFFQADKIITAEEVLTSFISQYYLSLTHEKPIPKRILLNKKLADKNWLENAISERINRKINIAENVRGTNRHWLEMSILNAEHALAIHLANKNVFAKSLQDLAIICKLPEPPKRIECFDVSHTAGEATIASCVVFNENGPLKKDYRRFRIENIPKSDDYAAIEQVLQRRYKTHELPDLVIIDGGKGHLNRAKSVLKNIAILAIAKGPLRKPGAETIYATTLSKPFSLAENSPVLHLLQRIRDEAHRFAITGHRKKLCCVALKSIT